MNKCNFCAYSIPTGQMGAWICEYKEYVARASYCEKAIKTNDGIQQNKSQ